MAPATEHIETVIVGGGQAGLSVGYHLSRRGRPFVILDANEGVGDAWRQRWDSLRLFTPARYDGLPGLPFPAAGATYPSKDEMADYLEAYAARFSLPVRTGVRVTKLQREDGRFLVTAVDHQIEADNVVVAMSNYQRPRVPSYASDLDPGIVQLHSADYRNAGQLRPGAVLVVGAGNSGAEIALEVAPTHETSLAGRDTGHVPFDIDGPAARLVLAPIVFRVVFHRVIRTDTPIGRRLHAKFALHGMPLVRTKPATLAAAGIHRTPRVTGVRNGLPTLADERVLPVTNVVWCTGFHPDFSWIHIPVVDDRGIPTHRRGIVASQPGLYFVGLHFLYAASSAMIHGVGRDAEHVVEAITG